MKRPENTVIGKWKYPKDKFVYEKQILLKQTNLFGNTYFSNYIEWQGEAREKFFLEHPNAETFLKSNQHLKMVTHSLYHRFLENAFFGDKIRIEVTSKEVLKYSFMLILKYFNVENGRAIGDGWQKIGFYNEKRRSLWPVPKIFLDLLLPVLNYDEKVVSKSMRLKHR